jgi:tRNA(Arg) A34 adenosine deaminase TadA
MRLAIDAARRGIAAGQSPFGCAIAREGRVLAVSHNTVLATIDTTAHAEINAIRSACHASQSIHLSGAVVATTCEPCPMCMAALHWARVADVYYGATIADAAAAGFNELRLPAAQLVAASGSPVHLQGNMLREACQQLFDQWLQRPDHRAY